MVVTLMWPVNDAQTFNVQADAEDFKSAFDDSYTSGIQRYERAPVRGLQYFGSVPDEDVVGKPYRHVAADMQVRSARPRVPSAETLQAFFLLLCKS